MHRFSGTRLQLLLSSAIFATIATPVLAQTAAPATTAPADAAAVDTNDGIGEIVVTATKRETNLQQTPIAISVVGAEMVKDRHVQSLYDLADGGVPSLRVATFEARQSALTIGIRGIVPLDANQPAREQGVGIYIDGVYLGRQHGLNAALFDVERIEVLKGPQGTLFGRNTEGGALSIVARAPSGEFGGRIGGSYGNYGSYTGDVHLDLPEYHNFSVKLDGIKQYQGAVTANPLAGQTGWGYYDRTGFRAAVRWRPTSDITNDFSYDVANDKNSPFYSQLLNYNPNGCAAGTQASQPNCYLPGTAYTALTGTVKPLFPGVVVNGTSRMKVADIGVPQQPSVDNTHGFTNTFKFKASPEIELRSITAWRGVTATQWDNAGGAHRVPVLSPGNVVVNGVLQTGTLFSRYSLANLRQTQFSQEFQAVGTFGSVDYVAGLFYFNEHVSDDAATPNSNFYNSTTGIYSIVDPCARITTGFTVVGGVPVGGTTSPAGSQPGCRSIDRASEVTSKSYAAYGQFTWNVTDALHLTVGGRYTHDKKRGVLHFSRNLNYDTATPTQLAAAGYSPLDKSWDRFNPMATVAYDVSDGFHVYAKYATGYRAGGASSRTSNYQPFNPEDVKSYEIGLKSDLFDRRVRLNLAGYIMERKDSQVDISSIQTTATGSFNNLVTINAAGITKIRGIEADVIVKPFSGLTLTGAYAYTYTDIPLVPIVNSVCTLANTTPANCPVANLQSTTVNQKFYIVFTPRNAASGAIDYELPIGGSGTAVKFHIDANYAQATQAFDQFATKADSSFIVNGRVSLLDIPVSDGGQKLTVGIWGRNIFDYQYVYRRDPSNSLPGAPTTNVFSGSVNNVLGDYGNFNAPRTFGVDASLKF